MTNPVLTRAQYEAALAALGLDPATTLSANLASDWAQIVHTDRAMDSGPIGDPEPEPDEDDEEAAGD